MWPNPTCICSLYLFILKVSLRRYIVIEMGVKICDRLCINRPFTAKHRNPVLRHPLTELLLITTNFLFFQYDLLFSSYRTVHVCVIQLKMSISRNVRFELRFRTACTSIIYSPRTICFASVESIYRLS